MTDKVIDLLAALETAVANAKAARARHPQYRCALCDEPMSLVDLAHIDGKPYCHPSDSADTTCYMVASWGGAPSLPVAADPKNEEQP